MPLVPLQQADPVRYKAWVESSQQPAAQLQETQAAAGAAGASATRSMQDVAINQRQLVQQQFIKEAQTLFNAKKDKSGHVDPDLFNKTKQAATSLGIGGDTFDSNFATAGYVDPNNIIKYNTSEGLANQEAYGQIKRQVQTLLDQYHNIPKEQKGIFSAAQLAGIPVLGQILAPHAIAYERSRSGLSAQLKSLAGGGTGSGLRVTQAELNRWSNLLPTSIDNPKVAYDNINQISNELKATWNLPQGLDKQYLPNKGRPPLSSFTQ